MKIGPYQGAGFIGKCKVGFMERPDRVVLVIIGALFSGWGVMAPVL